MTFLSGVVTIHHLILTPGATKSKGHKSSALREQVIFMATTLCLLPKALDVSGCRKVTSL